jgi:ankyrin repeat protein
MRIKHGRLSDPILNAIWNNDIEGVRAALRNRASANGKRCCFLPAFGPSPLVLALERASMAIIDELLVAGADPNRRSRGFSPLGKAAVHGRIDAIALLLKHGADLQRSMALTVAVQFNEAESVRFLLTQGINPNAHLNENSARWYRVSDEVLSALLDAGWRPPDAVSKRIAQSKRNTRQPSG